MISPSSQISLLTGIQLDILKWNVATISSIENPSLRELLLYLSILEPAFAGKFILIVGNLIYKPLAVKPKQSIAYVHLLSVSTSLVSPREDPFAILGSQIRKFLSFSPLMPRAPLTTQRL